MGWGDRMNPANLFRRNGPIPRNLLTLAMAWVVGCGAPDLSQFDEVRCNTTGSTNEIAFLDGLNLASKPDYVEMRIVQHFPSGVIGGVMSQMGEKCSTATDKAQCEAALANLGLGSADAFHKRISCSGVNHCWCITSSSYFVTTQGDMLEMIVGQVDLRKSLGPIDTAQEAVLIAWAMGYDVSCGNKQDGAVRAVSDGYEVIATKSSSTDPTGCMGQTTRYRYVLHVDRAGTVQETWTETIKR